MYSNPSSAGSRHNWAILLISIVALVLVFFLTTLLYSIHPQSSMFLLNRRPEPGITCGSHFGNGLQSYVKVENLNNSGTKDLKERDKFQVHFYFIISIQSSFITLPDRQLLNNFQCTSSTKCVIYSRNANRKAASQIQSAP